jgi:hypothetical protein
VGAYPGEWEYAGRERIFFVAERAIHERSLQAYALPQLPPEVRVAQTAAARAARPRCLPYEAVEDELSARLLWLVELIVAIGCDSAEFRASART